MLRKLIALCLIGIGTFAVTFLGLTESPSSYISQASPLNSGVTRVAVEPTILSGVKVGDLDLSNLSLKEATEKLRQYEHKKTFIAFPHKAQAVYYSDLGLRVDYHVLKDYVMDCLPYDVTCKEILPVRPLSEVLIDLDHGRFDSFLDTIDVELHSYLEGVDVSFDELTFKANDPEADLLVNREALKSELVADKVFTDEIIFINTLLRYPQGLDSQRGSTERLIRDVSAQSLLIKYGREPVYIESEVLSGFIVTFSNPNGELIGRVSEEKIGEYLDSLVQLYDLEVTMEKSAAVKSIAYALLFRAGGEPSQTAVILPLQGESRTNGTYAEGKYLEINKSQQRMYAFDGGELIKTYIIGTGLTWETPSGEFRVLRKEGTAISYSGNWFMPYYMPIGKIYGYNFGFHEIPFKKDAYGNITSRDVNSMGSPATGGCIQLYREDSAELYEWAEVGTPVVIYE